MRLRSCWKYSERQVISLLRASLRFDGVSNVDITELQTNLMPQSSIYFMLSHYAFIISAEKAHHEQLSVAEITMSVLVPTSMMITCDLDANCKRTLVSEFERLHLPVVVQIESVFCRLMLGRPPMCLKKVS